MAQINPPEWRSLYRCLLRETTYLPDPIAKGFMHDHTRQRFRRYTSSPDTGRGRGRGRQTNTESEPEPELDIHKQHQLRKQARQRLTLLRRANEGYTKPLEQVLRLSYGRTGRRRRELITRFITPTPVPSNTTEVQEIVNTPSLQDDKWTPPQLILDLLKSQQRNGVLHELGARPFVKTLEPPIPAENAWGKPVSIRRRVNIRREWYGAVLECLFPPLPGEESRILRGLIDGSVHWTPPKRRAAQHYYQSGAGSGSGTGTGTGTGQLNASFLVDGPSKGHTFRKYVDGRPHTITRRFMRRLWQRILCLVPMISWSEASGRYMVDWEPVKPLPRVAVTLDPQHDLFAGYESLSGQRTGTHGSKHL